jgi:hypothetical protein
MVKDTDFAPEEAYVTLCGPAPTAVAGLAPVPKFHDQEVAPVEVFVKVTVCPTQAGLGEAVKLAVAPDPVKLMLSTKRRLPYPERFLKATMTFDCPT